MKLIRMEEQIKMLISEFASFSCDEIFIEDKLVDIGINVPDIAKLITRVNEVFGVSIDKSAFDTMMTVHKFIELVESHM